MHDITYIYGRQCLYFGLKQDFKFVSHTKIQKYKQNFGFHFINLLNYSVELYATFLMI